METIITGVIILAAAVWFVRWLKGTASGEKGCSCSGCSKESCPSRSGRFTEEAQ